MRNKEKMQEDIIYEEKIFPKVEIWELGFVIILSFFLLVYFFVGYHTISWIPLFVFLVFTVITYKFREFNIKMTLDSVIVNYEFDKRTILWENINDYYLDEASDRYGDVGLCIVNGEWRNVYNVIGYPRIVLSLKDAGFCKDLVFSTKNPEQVMKIINEKIKKI